ncbi:MAG: molybdopterin molybdotransferase MoeA [Firmicutes bacterium]|nr:molybdopterin molybdotransferase MoeA [Bacillota bacterium]
MIAIEDAQEILLRQLEHLVPKTNNLQQIPLWHAGGRVLAQNIIAAENFPAFDRSLVDGFALSTQDTTGATAGNPVTLAVKDTIAAGSDMVNKLIPNTATRIFTGAPLPQGADCVVKQEEVTETTDNSNEQMIHLMRPQTKGDGVGFKGEDIAAGDLLINKGTIITAAHLGVLATLGVDPVPVFKQPEIGVFSTGDELIEVGSHLRPGKLRASNIYVLSEIIRQAGGVPINFGIVRDSVEEVIKIYEEAERREIPLVISTGGTASGDYDVIKAAMDKFSGQRLFNKVTMRPGAPVVVTAKPKQLLIGLSGNPAGATVAMMVLIYPLVARLAGSKHDLQRRQALLAQPIFYNSGFRGYFWGNYRQEGSTVIVSPLVNQFCGSIKNYANSNCLIEVPEGKNINCDETVTILILP